MTRKFLINILLLFSVFLLFNCGTGGSDAPAGSTITIFPSEITYASIATTAVVNISVTVKNAKGIPLNDVDLDISGGFAAPRVPTRYQFFRNRDADSPVNSGFVGTTNSEGVYDFSIRIDGSSDFADTIYIQSATVTGSVAVTLGSTT